MTFVKALIASAALLASTVSFAAESTVYTNCEVGTVSTDRGVIDVNLSAQGKFKPSAAFEISLVQREVSDEAATVAGLKARIVKSSAFDTFKYSNCAWAHCYTTTTRVFPVKVELTAEETIGFEIRGDVGMPVQKVVNYGTCYEATTVSTHM
jgi:hypothetical protein